MIQLARVAARFGSLSMTHIRDEADRSFKAVREAITIGEQEFSLGAPARYLDATR